MKRYLANPDATRSLGAALAGSLAGGGVVYLHGDLGAGKTTLVRGLLWAMGHQGVVRSPTYTLIEPYELDGTPVFHLDLYRLADPEELDYLGIRELDRPGAVVLVEWPERGAGALPAADLELWLAPEGEGRALRIAAQGEKGASILRALAKVSL